LFTKSARYYDALYSFKDYEDAARRIHETIQALRPGARRLLDVGCGTGRHLETLRRWYDVEGADIGAELIEVARERLPGIPLHHQDMASLALPHRFDVITCLFSAIAYVKTAARLEETIAAFARHLEPGGLAIIEPFFSPDRYWTDRVTLNVVNEEDLKIVWMYSSTPPEDGIATLDIHYLVGTPEGVDHFTERHELGLFSDDDYGRAFKDAGLAAYFDPEGYFGRGAFVAVRPER
jgi:SAM-dependent methyltransferase